jgi:hypothetical protein
MGSMHATQVARPPDGSISVLWAHHVGLAAVARLRGGEKSVGGSGTILIMESIASGPYWPVLAQTELGAGVERHQRAHSTSCMAPMV